jgi:hypothetical protein
MTPIRHRAWAILPTLAFALTAHAVPIAGQGTWESTLHARDIDGDGTPDAYYDSTLGITWLADANAAAGGPFDDGGDPSDGELTWAAANAWAAALDLHGTTGWRLPRMGAPTGSELSHMYCVTLANYGPCNPETPSGPGTWGFTNTGPFANLFSDWYWTGTLDDPGPPVATAWIWAADPISAYHTAEAVGGDYFAWAVREGDVAVVPEPSIGLLMLGGLALLARRRR